MSSRIPTNQAESSSSFQRAQPSRIPSNEESRKLIERMHKIPGAVLPIVMKMHENPASALADDHSLELWNCMESLNERSTEYLTLYSHGGEVRDPERVRQIDADIKRYEEESQENANEIVQLEDLVPLFEKKLEEIKQNYFSILRNKMKEFEKEYFSRGFSARITECYLRTQNEIDEAKITEKGAIETEISEEKQREGFIARISPRLVVDKEEVAIAYTYGRKIEWIKGDRVHEMNSVAMPIASQFIRIQLKCREVRKKLEICKAARASYDARLEQLRSERLRLSASRSELGAHFAQLHQTCEETLDKIADLMKKN